MAAKNVADFYPLSPMQQGMLFHSMLAPVSGVYVEQLSCIIRGELDLEAFERAWNMVVERHTILRTGFLWEGVKEPVQVVQRSIQLPFQVLDWRELTPDAQKARLESYLAEDRRQGFDLTRAPLMRLAVMKTAPGEVRFVWSHHHILMDGWSQPLLFAEFLRFYEVYRQGREWHPAPPRPYREYIAWLRKQDVSRAEAFWRQNLAGFTTPTPLVVDRPPAGGFSEEGIFGEQEIWLPPETTGQLREFARQNHLTLSTLVYAAWGLLLGRYNDSEDVLFGATVSGRPADLPGSERMVGLFINTLPVRVAIDPSASILAWLKEFQSHLAVLRQYEYSPLVDIHGWSEVPQGTSLFESILVFENYPTTASLQTTGSDLAIDDVHSFESTNYPLTVVVGASDELLLKLLYQAERYDGDTIQRMLGHLETILDGFLRDPNQPLKSLPLMTEAEQRQLQDTWIATSLDFPRDQNAVQLVETQVERTPHALAATYGEMSLTYHELNSKANQLANYLCALGVGPDRVVGLCVERSLDLIVGALAVLKAGGAYLPLDPTYPVERLAFMLEDAQALVLLTQEKLDDRFALFSLQRVCLDSVWPAIADNATENLPCRITLSNLAYLIYTSGSTGQPKGVQIEHLGLLNLIFWHIHAFGITPEDRATQIAGPGFDASVWEIWPYLAAGASLHIPDEERRAAPQALCDWLVAHHITVTFLPTPLAEIALGLNWPRDAALRYMLTGGDKLHRYPPPGLPFVLVNNYGPTENTVVTTSGVVPAENGDNRAPAIGRSISNTQVYILDSSLRPVPVGVPGEIYIGGLGLARGYKNRPDLTAESFIRDPFAPGSGKRLYRSGDLARYLPGGEIEFLGRIDTQIKIRGFRVELGEIEAVLAAHGGVREAAVLAREVHPGDVRLFAFIVPEPGQAVPIEELRRYLSAKLPEYMLPAAFIQLDALPITPNGKVDRRALQERAQWQPEKERIYQAPATPEEQLVAGIWENTLNLPAVGATDNFFALGGHSLLATQVVSRLRDAFQVDLPLRVVFEYPTVKGLARQIDILGREQRGLTEPPIRPASRQGDLPLSFAQQRLWFLEQLEPGTPFYNLPVAVRFSGPLDIGALEKSLNEVIRRHEALRTVFHSRDGSPVQVVQPAFELPLAVTDLSGLPEFEREEQARQQATAEILKPFDLEHGPLLRVILYRLDAQEHIAVLVLHHIISDGWSMGIFVQELVTLYLSHLAGEPSSLPELPIQYPDFAVWQREWLQGEVLEKQLAYWKKQLDDLPPMLSLPTDHPRPPIQSWRGASLSFELSSQVTGDLHALCRKVGVTPFMALLAAFQALLYRYSGQEDIAVGTPIANRNRSQVESMIGFFVNILVMRGDLSGEPTFGTLLKRVRETALDAYAHQDLPFEMLVDALQPERDLSHSPLFQVLFVLQNAPLGAQELPNLRINPVDLESGTVRFDLTLAMVEDGDHLSGTLEYNSDLFDRPTIQRMAEHFHVLLTQLVAQPDQPVGKGSLLSEAEREALAEWNMTQVDLPEGCTHQLFEAQVEKTPSALAVKFQDQALTYRDLNTRANRLAHYLRRQGIGPESVVPLCLNRSLEMMVAILGVLKAGGAYLPLDPQYPADRLKFVLDEVATLSPGRPPLVLTQADPAQKLVLLGTDLLILDRQWEAIAQNPATNPTSYPDLNNLAYVIYTSGSTGVPKGVMLEHQGLKNVALAFVQEFGLGPGSHVLQYFSYTFDGSVPEIFSALLSGATLFLVDRDELLPGADLARWLAEQHITYAVLTPSMLAAMPDAELPELGILMAAGETCSAEIAARWMKGRRFYNGYGPTEGTVAACWYPLPEIPGKGANIPIGRPLPNVTLHVLDKHMQPLPVGFPGELYIGGLGVARGYLNRDDLTAKSFFPDPFSNQPGARLYKTGDLARYLPGGVLSYLGRADTQVKIRGFRIELGEIEAVLSGNPQLKEVAVVVRWEHPGEGRLVAYVVPRENERPQTSELRTYLSEKLPSHMIPAVFVVLEALPRTPSGKIDRRRLPIPALTRAHVTKAYVAPRNPTEQILADIWAQVLGLQPVTGHPGVGIHDNFFELGGDSILTIQVISRARGAGLHLSPKQFFQHPTVAGLAEVARSEVAVSAEQGPVTGTVPLTPIQHWFFDHFTVEPHHWNSSMLLEVGYPLDPNLLEQAIQHLVAHHDALRLRYSFTPSGWRQELSRDAHSTPLATFDLAGLTSREQSAQIEKTAAALQASLNLTEGPLMRVAYFDLGAERPARLLLIFHHLILDGVSWRIFLDDLMAVYLQLARGDATELPPKSTSFRRWAIDLNEYAQSAEVLQELSYWLGVAGQQSASLPVDHPQGDNTFASTELFSSSLSAEATQALLQWIPATSGIQIQEVLLAALGRTLSAWSGQSKFLIELEGHGREDILEGVDVSRTVGWFTSAFPLWLDLENAREPGEALSAVQSQLELVPQNGIGFGLLRYLHPDGRVQQRLAKIPPAQVNFNYLGQFGVGAAGEEAPIRVASEAVGPQQSPRQTRTALLYVVCVISGRELDIQWNYSRNQLRRETITRLADLYLDELRRLIDYCLHQESAPPMSRPR